MTLKELKKIVSEIEASDETEVLLLTNSGYEALEAVSSFEKFTGEINPKAVLLIGVSDSLEVQDEGKRK